MRQCHTVALQREFTRAGPGVRPGIRSHPYCRSNGRTDRMSRPAVVVVLLVSPLHAVFVRVPHLHTS